jgi:fumarate hydratase class II
MEAAPPPEDAPAFATDARHAWGPQTHSAMRHFAISTERMPESFLRALAIVKKVCAQANADLGVLPAEKAQAIQHACNEVLAGRHDDDFPLRIWQSGSGTQTHMNMNEVLANVASRHAATHNGQAPRIHPNDDVNRSQSTNDIFPTALQVAAALAITHELLPALRRLRTDIQAVALRGAHIEKVGRTHLQDAVNMTVGQEWSAFDAQVAQAAQAVEHAREAVLDLPVGGTAVGTGLNAPAAFGAHVCQGLSAWLALPFREAPNKFAAIAAHDALVALHGALRQVATVLMKLANDVRWLASGPRCGLGELLLPANEPGSSIMPGKVNPTQCESLMMVCMQVLGNDVVMGFCGASGNLQLNTFLPLMAHTLMQSFRLLVDGCMSFSEHGLKGLAFNETQLRWYQGRSLMGITAHTPDIGYDRAARIATRAHQDDSSLAEAARALGEPPELVARLQGSPR